MRIVPTMRVSPLARLTKPVRNQVVIACVLQGVSAAAGAVPFIAVAELGRTLLASGEVDTERVWWIAGAAVASMLLRLIAQLAAGGLTHWADLDLQLHLRREIASHLSRVPLGWFNARSTGVVKKALQDDVATLHHLVGHAYTDIVTSTVMPLVALSYLLWVDWRLMLVSAIPLVLGTILYALQFKCNAQKTVANNEALANVNAAAVEFVQGIAVIKTFGQARKAYGRFVERTQAFVDFYWDWVRGLIGISAATETVLSPLCSLLTVLAAGLLFVEAGLVQPVDVIPFAVLAPGLTAPLITLAYAYNDMTLAKDAADRITTLLDTPMLSLHKPTHAPDSQHQQSTQQPQGNRVVLEGVHFAYDGQHDVLHGVDLVLEPGTVTALVGPSGSGKSTLAQLLPRFWDVRTGQITISGVDVATMAPETLYSSVGFVFQHVQLLRASMAENIALGRPDASQKEIEAVARAAQIHQRILELPNGYDSIAGEDARLSGGEAQRVSIARALLADAPILVLDEATAFADPESEAAIQDALSTLVAGRTLLVIAHRLHTITDVDQICVLDGGRIVERGKHNELLALGGAYATLWAASEAALGHGSQGTGGAR